MTRLTRLDSTDRMHASTHTYIATVQPVRYGTVRYSTVQQYIMIDTVFMRMLLEVVISYSTSSTTLIN
jgi:hypothetical protein